MAFEGLQVCKCPWDCQVESSCWYLHAIYVAFLKAGKVKNNVKTWREKHKKTSHSLCYRRRHFSSGILDKTGVAFFISWPRVVPTPANGISWRYSESFDANSVRICFWGGGLSKNCIHPTSSHTSNNLHYTCKSRSSLKMSMSLGLSATKIRSRIENNPWGIPNFGIRIGLEVEVCHFLHMRSKNCQNGRKRGPTAKILHHAGNQTRRTYVWVNY